MSLKDKASKLNFASLPSVGALPADESAAKPKTAPGAMMAFANDQRSSLLRENDELKTRIGHVDEVQRRLDDSLADLKQWDGAKAARLIDAAEIRPSRFANRHSSNFEGTEFESLLSEIRDAGGNIQAIKVRRLANQSGANYELVFGHRRWEACRRLGLPVLAVIDNVDDRSLFTEMDRENRLRKDLSAWEQGVMYRRALDEGLFPSNKKMAEAIGVDLGALGRSLLLADLPSEVVEAFPSPLALQFRFAKPLGDALKADAKGVKSRAKELANRTPKPSAKQVMAELVNEKGRGVEPFNPLAKVYQINGRRVSFRTSKSGATSVLFGAGALSEERAAAVRALIESFVESADGT